MFPIYHPWTISKKDSPNSRWEWSLGYLEFRGIRYDSKYLKQPANPQLVQQIEHIVKWSMGSRRWMLCMSESISYLRELFSFVLCSYVLTTNARAMVVDVDDLTNAVDDPEGEKRDIIEHADLLLINHCDKDNPHLKFKRGAICNVFYRRRQKDLATILGLFVKDIPKKMDSAQSLVIAKNVVDIFGESSFDLFTDSRSKRIVVRVPKGEKKNGSEEKGRVKTA